VCSCCQGVGVYCHDTVKGEKDMNSHTWIKIRQHLFLGVVEYFKSFGIFDKFYIL
jgi:hypothetical protein